MITIYNQGCVCGWRGRMIRKIKRYARERNIKVEVINSKYDLDVKLAHLYLLTKSNISSTSTPIVVNGDSVIPLAQWKP